MCENGLDTHHHGLFQEVCRFLMYALLIADETDEAAILAHALQRTGVAVTSSNDLERAMRSWSERPADLVLIAWHKTNPTEQLRRIRAETEAMLAMVIDPVSEITYCKLLENGADHIVTRPFSSRRLAAHVRAMLRRAGSVPLLSLPKLDVGGLVLDPTDRTVQVNHRPRKRLTHLEFRLLYTLMTHMGQVLPTDTIVDRVWGYSDQGDRELVRGLVSRLRSKVEPESQRPRYIHTVAGVGYTFRFEELK